MRAMVTSPRLTRALSIAALLGLAACSNGTGTQNPTMKPGVVMPGPGPGPGPGPTNNYDAGVPSGQVVVQIISPVATPPDDKPTLPTSAVADVSAKVTISAGGTDLVDPSTVHMTLATAAGQIIADAPLVGPVADSQYNGRLSLARLKSGEYTITVSAHSTTNVAGSASVDVRLDAGPVITVLSPVPGRHYKQSLLVQFAVEPGEFAPASDVQATIAGTSIVLMPAGPPNQYRALVDLTKPIALTGDQIFTASAKNARGTRTDLPFIFNVDVDGPQITQTTPIPGDIVGGVVRVAARVTDGAGLNDASVQALIGDKTTPQLKLALMREGTTDVFSALFDSKVLTACKLTSDLCIVRPSISFRAADLLGNDRTVGYEIALDNIPPIADLAPPPIRDSKLDTGLRCSHSFDPLDHNTTPGDAPDDLCQIPQMFDLRARIQDDGNAGFFTKQIPVSLVDPDATAVYVLDAPTVAGQAQPLVVDTDGDEYCDAVNPKLEPTTLPLTGPRQVLKLRMRPVPPGGKADFATPDPALPPECLPGIDLDPPEDLCRGGPQPSLAISYLGTEAAIWSIEPIAPDDPAYCFGSQFDALANNVAAVHPADKTQPALAPAAGWKCIAVVTADMAGNTSTSAPLRVYLDDYKYGGSLAFCKAPPANAGPPPSCTGTYDKATQTVSPKACKTRGFPPGEICYKGDC
jgi:hypothetical protein